MQDNGGFFFFSYCFFYIDCFAIILYLEVSHFFILFFKKFLYWIFSKRFFISNLSRSHVNVYMHSKIAYFDGWSSILVLDNPWCLSLSLLSVSPWSFLGASKTFCVDDDKQWLIAICSWHIYFGWIYSSIYELHEADTTRHKQKTNAREFI